MKILIFLFCLFPFCLGAQSLPNVVPPSPQTRELNKYIDFPVDLSTGVPGISIPLYTVRTKGIEIPITLSYHASGIKSGQDDGDVGVGWSLSSNYRISRTIYGFADTRDIVMSPSSYQSNIGSLSTLNLDKYLSRFASDYPGSLNPDTHMPPRSGGLLDGEYDQFNYLVPGQGGKFIISDRIAGTVTEFSPTTNRFGYTEGIAANNMASGIIGFSMKDAGQNVFSFGEQAANLGGKVLETHNGGLNQRDVTAWALTDIDTRYGEKIRFGYAKKAISTKYALETTLTVTEPRPNSYDVWEYNLNEESSSSNYSIFSLSSISTANERVDIVNLNPGGSGPNKIKQINVTDSLTGTLLKRIEFYYSENFIYPSSYTFLDSIKIFDKDLLNYEKYSFDYYDKDLPSSTILVPDQWGYNKFGADRSKLLHQEFGSDLGFPPGDGYHTTQIGTNTLYYKSGYGGRFTDRKSNEFPHIFSLKTISYPTGGKTLFEYEPNKISYNYSGGIRIKSIKEILSQGQYNANGYERIKSYTYGINETGNGYSNYYLGENDFRREQVSFEELLGAYTPRKKTIYSSKPLSAGSQATYYQHITEKNGSNNGKTTYFFSAIPPISTDAYPVTLTSNDISLIHYGSGPRYITDYTEWKKPNLLRKEYYNAANVLLKKDSYTYLEKPGTYFLGLKVYPFARYDELFYEANPYNYGMLSSFYNHGLYSITTGKDLLASRSEVTYSGNDSLRVTTGYTYNDLDQVVRETTVDSRNKTVEKSWLYPTDTQGDYYGNRMLQANAVDKVLEETVTVNGGIVGQVTNQYSELPGEIFVLDRIRRYNTDTQLQEEGTIFHRYDAKGNVLGLSRADGPMVSYIWSYGSRYPIAEITNASYSAIESILGVPAINTFSNLAAPDRTSVEAFLMPLRTALPHAHITSFSYEPLVGMKSQTDAKGMTTFYEYDTFGRLENVKDQRGDIVKNYRYNYSDGTALPVRATTYYNTVLAQVFTKSCPGGGVAVTYTVEVGKHTSTQSQAAADALAQADATANGQAYANSHGSCSTPQPGGSYPNDAFTITRTKNNCTVGETGSSVGYAVPAGTYTSTISQADARTQAEAMVAAAAQANANNLGTCSTPQPGSYPNDAFIIYRTKNNCISGQVGSSVPYTVPAGTYTSTISQADARIQAEAMVAISAQAIANAQGSCSVDNNTFILNFIAPLSSHFALVIRDMSGNIISQPIIHGSNYLPGMAGGGTGSVSIEPWHPTALTFSYNLNGTVIGSSPALFTNVPLSGTVNLTVTQTKFFNVVKTVQRAKNDCPPGGTGVPYPVSYTVPAGTYMSLVSQADADQQAQNDINANAQAFANANGTCPGSSTQLYIYYVPEGSALRIIATHLASNTTVSRDIYDNTPLVLPNGPTSIRVASLDPGKHYNFILATETSIIENIKGNPAHFGTVDLNGLPIIFMAQEIFYNTALTVSRTRNDCTGSPGPAVSYTVAAGTYESEYSQQDADYKAQDDANANAQAHANTYGTCIGATVYQNALLSQGFSRNDCLPGQTGSAVTYTVPAGSYSAGSQAAADNLAAADMAANGQVHANANGTCNGTPVYGNVLKSQDFKKNNCSGGQTGTAWISYTVAAGTYTAGTQAAADALATADIAANGQAHANSTGSCTVAGTVFARFEKENDVVADHMDQDPATLVKSADWYLRLYSDAACTIPYTATSDLDINVRMTTRSLTSYDPTEQVEVQNAFLNIPAGYSYYPLGNMNYSYYYYDGYELYQLNMVLEVLPPSPGTVYTPVNQP